MVRLLIDTYRTAEHQPGRLRGELTSQEIKKYVAMCLKPGKSTGLKNPPKWQKNDLVSGGHGRAAKLGACVNWWDWLRTSADKRMWSGRRAVVMVR